MISSLTPGRSMRTVTVLDLVCLLANTYRGAARDDVGFEDATMTIEALTTKLNAKVRVDIRDIESCLWACNLLDERKQFWHPKDLNFDQFIAKLLPDAAFDKTYNFIMEK